MTATERKVRAVERWATCETGMARVVCWVIVDELELPASVVQSILWTVRQWIVCSLQVVSTHSLSSAAVGEKQARLLSAAGW